MTPAAEHDDRGEWQRDFGGTAARCQPRGLNNLAEGARRLIGQ